MSNFRIFILAFLVVVLVVLGMIYVNISSRMDVIQQQQQMASAPVPVTPSPYIPMPTQAPASAVQPVVVADPVAVSYTHLDVYKRQPSAAKRSISGPPG